MSRVDEKRTSATIVREPLSILIGALGGEGGGILTDWLVDAATREDFPVQSTSIPGVAQRTGATFYYIEIFPVTRTELGGKQPVLSLYPFPGQIDLAIFTELVEAGRSMENGYVTPDRTTLIASTHRIYSVFEKSAMADGRFNDEGILQAAKRMAKHSILFDLAKVASESGSIVNAVLLGAIASSGILPIAPEVFQESIRKKAVAVKSHLKGFAAGTAVIDEPPVETMPSAPEPVPEAPTSHQIPEVLRQHMKTSFPLETHQILQAGLNRLMEYQGVAYARKYLTRLQMILLREKAEKYDHSICQEVARYLALWMSYEDVIRVADLKTRARRFAGVYKEIGAKPGEPVHITDFLAPGLDEICSVLPPFLARPLLRLGKRYPRLGNFRIPIQMRTDTIWGFLRLWLIARLRRLRPFTYRYRIEQDLIEDWLGQVVRVMEHDHALAMEIVRCAHLLKGYGDTYEQGKANFSLISDSLIRPALVDRSRGFPAPETVRHAREAALSDPEGKALKDFLHIP